MSKVTYDPKDLTITVAGVEDIEKQLGDLKHKTPAAMKFAINATARKTRKLMLDRAKARYAVTAKGREHIDELMQKRKARNTSLLAELYIISREIDRSYFEHSPIRAFEGPAVRWAPKHFKSRILKSSPMRDFTAGYRSGPGDVSKAFLLTFKSGHVGMVQRDIGSESDNLTTIKNRRPRWIPPGKKKPEKLVTAYAPSGPAMHNTIWPDVEPTAAEVLQEQLQRRVDMILAKAGKG